MRTLNNSIPQTSVSRVPELVERSDGLWEFTGDETLDEAVAIFQKIDGGVESSRWAMAAIAASTSKKYGEGRLEEFAEKVGRKLRKVQEWARTYRLVTEKRLYRRNCDKLSFSHYVEAVRYLDDPDHALDVGMGMSAIGLREWVSEKNGVTKASKPKRKQKQNEFREYLTNLDQKLAGEISDECPDVDFKRRVISSWREDIDWALKDIE